MKKQLFAALFVLPLALSPALARAEPTAAAKTAAREKAAQGLALLDEKRWAEAYEIFKEADALYHVPTLTLAMAECQAALGKLLAARDLYRRVIDEPLAPDAAEPIRKARVTATSELAALEKRIPTLAVAVSGADAERARVEVDGVQVSGREIAAGRALDPGDHVVSATSEGGASARLSVKLPEGARTQVELVLRPAIASAPDRRGSLVPAAIAFGVGGAGVIAGAITGALALVKSNDIRGRCQTIGGDLHCLAADAPERDAAQALRGGSIAAFVIGGAALATGTVLAVVRPGGGKAPPVEVRAGAAWLGVRGRF